MQTATRADLVNITDLVRTLREDWPRHIIEAVLTSHHHKVDMADLAIACIRYASDPTNVDPRGMGWSGRHWKGLATHPERKPTSSARCYVCGKTEDRCINERPGPDDHRFEPTAPRDLAVTR